MNRHAFAKADRALVDRLRDAVRELEPEARLILYGSRARGDAHRDSDWDLLILLEGPSDEARQQALRQRLLDVALDTGAVVSPITMSSDEWDSPVCRVSPFRANVEDDGIDLTAGGALERLRARSRRVMTEAEMAGARDELVQTWLNDAREALVDAEVTAHGGRWNACVNRLYYACFHAVSALLLRHGYRFSKHGSVHSLFNQHFGKTGMVPADLVALSNHLFNGRLIADYRGGARFEEAEVRPWIGESRRLVARIEELLRTGV